MILLKRFKEYAEVLTSSKKKLTAEVNGVAQELIVDSKEDNGDMRCFGQYYILECKPSDTIRLFSGDIVYAFCSK